MRMWGDKVTLEEMGMAPPEVIIKFECCNCKQKDQRIAELEKKLEENEDEIRYYRDNRVSELKDKISELEAQLAIRDKALRIAHKNLQEYSNEEFYSGEEYYGEDFDWFSYCLDLGQADLVEEVEE